MIPKIDLKVNDGVELDFEIEEQPSLTWKLDFKNNRILDNIDEKEAIEQVVYLILQTERYEWLIHSFEYGCEVHTLIGEPTSYAIPEIERFIKEALLQDDRITNVHSFEFTVSKKSIVIVKFIVEHIFGELEVIDRRDIA